LLSSNDAVKFVRWPAQADLRTYCKEEGIPCLLIVEGKARPPLCIDAREDWVRSPISREDVEARVKALKCRVNARNNPIIDSTGVLYFNDQSLILSNTQATLMEAFVARFKEVVHRSELERVLAECLSSPTRNSLDLHIMRLRRRITMVNLHIRTVWGRGYLLEPKWDNSQSG
jgi:DNA-binding response OmpR family regulator